jgi:hypothetical protein
MPRWVGQRLRVARHIGVAAESGVFPQGSIGTAEKPGGWIGVPRPILVRCHHPCIVYHQAPQGIRDGIVPTGGVALADQLAVRGSCRPVSAGDAGDAATERSVVSQASRAVVNYPGSQTCTVVSEPPEAIYRPFGAQASAVTLDPRCPR